MRPVPTIVTLSITLHHGALDRGRDDVELRHQFAELRRIERLRPVTQCGFRSVMDFDQKSVGPGRNGSARHG